MERSSDSPLLWSTHSPNWAPTIREDELEPTTAMTPKKALLYTAPSSNTVKNNTVEKGLAFVSSSVMVTLLVVSVFMVLWGTVKLSQSIAQLTQIAVQQAMHPTSSSTP